MSTHRNEHEFDVIVVGAGPGGFATALVAARRGLRVLLLDRRRFPRDKICGDAITPLGMTMLAQLGVLEAVRAAADARVQTIQIASSGGEAARSITTSVLVLRRRVLDALLLDLVRPLVEVREGCAVDRLIWRDGQVCGVSGKTEAGARFDVTAGIVVGADGASSVIARLTRCRHGAAEQLLLATRTYYRGVTVTESALEFHFLPDLDGGYLWIFPLGGDLSNVGIGATVDCLRSSGRSLRGWCEHALARPELASRFSAAVQLSEFSGGQIPFTGTTQAISGAGFLLVGDAAGVADGFWGDGIDTALASGALAGAHAATACAGNDFTAEHLSGYRDSITRVLGGKLRFALERRRAATLASQQRVTTGERFS